MKKIPHNSNHSSLIFLLGFLIIIFLVGSIYFIMIYQNFRLTSDNENTNTKKVTLVKDIDTTDWKPYPYFSENLNLLFYYPDDWVNSQISMYDYYIGEEEGSITWLSSVNDNFIYEEDSSVSNYNFSLEKYFDTGDDLDTWVSKKIIEIKSNRGELLDTEDISYNGIDMKKVCNNGYIANSPSPVCFVYFQSSPYIIEIEVGSYNFDNYLNIQEYADAFASRIYLLDYKSQGWEKYVSNNMDYEIYYDPDNYPQGIYDRELYNSFGKESSGNSMQILISTGAVNDIEKYWYDQARGRGGEFPQDVYINGVKCLMANFKDDYYSNDNDYIKFFCLKNNKLYAISLFENSKDNALKDLLMMVASVKFNEISKVSNLEYKFIDNIGNFKISYPYNYNIYEEGGEIQPYISFGLNSDNRNYMGVAISYQKTDQTIDECIIDQTCLIYYSYMEDYSDTKFLGYSAKENITINEEGSTEHRSVIFKKDGIIYSININKIIGEDNTEVNNMLESFEFL